MVPRCMSNDSSTYYYKRGPHILVGDHQFYHERSCLISLLMYSMIPIQQPIKEQDFAVKNCCNIHYLIRAVSSLTSDTGKPVLFGFVVCPFVRLSRLIQRIYQTNSVENFPAVYQTKYLQLFSGRGLENYQTQHVHKYT